MGMRPDQGIVRIPHPQQLTISPIVKPWGNILFEGLPVQTKSTMIQPAIL